MVAPVIQLPQRLKHAYPGAHCKVQRPAVCVEQVGGGLRPQPSARWCTWAGACMVHGAQREQNSKRPQPTCCMSLLACAELFAWYIQWRGRPPDMVLADRDLD